MAVELSTRTLDQPVLTFYGADGSRTEFSERTFLNWQSKLANLFQLQYQIEPGDQILIDIESHWILPALIGAASCVDTSIIVGTSTPQPTRLAIVAANRLAIADESDDVLVCSPSLLGEPLTESLPIGVDDLFAETRMQADQTAASSSKAPTVIANGSAIDLGTPDLDTTILGTAVPNGKRILINDTPTASTLKRIIATYWFLSARQASIVWLQSGEGINASHIASQEHVEQELTI